MSKLKIRCPECSWEPEPGSTWWCDKCDHTWNTFDTGGKCPNCGFVYLWTECLCCNKTSPHADWYDWGDLTIEVVENYEEAEIEI